MMGDRRSWKAMTVAGALALILAFGQTAPARGAESQIAVVAAENFYGDIARQIGGDRISVTRIRICSKPLPESCASSQAHRS